MPVLHNSITDNNRCAGFKKLKSPGGKSKNLLQIFCFRLEKY
jgi:hypothetical protein